MRRRVLAMSAALVALAAPAATAATSTAATAGTPTVIRAEPAAFPLAVTIDQLTPSTIPSQGDVQVSGTVTNDDTTAWTTVKVYPFVSDEPMTTTAELEAAAATDPAVDVGSRIVDDRDRYDATIDSLAPGETAAYSFSVPRRILAEHVGHALTPGVYWFGVHALGQGPDGRDSVADGKARTFLPLVPQRATGQLPTSVVVPLRRPITYQDDGSLAGLDGWTQSLSEGGRLSSLVDLAADGGDGADLSWLVDPALLDAVRRLAAGNPPRSLAPNLTPGQADGEPNASQTASPEPGGSIGPAPPSPTSGDAAGEDGSRTDGESQPLSEARLARLQPDGRAAALAAQDWLARFAAAVHPGDELLVLPYGDTDVAGAARQDAKLYRVARARANAATILPGLSDVAVVPAIGSPSGYLNADALGLVGSDTTALITDQMLPADDTVVSADDTVVSADGHDLVATSTAAAAGGPGPDDPTAVVAMRQRLLAEAALRFLQQDTQPLVVELPHDWNPTGPEDFLDGLEVPWLDLTTVTGAKAAATPVPLASNAIRYPESQTDAELDAGNFEAAARLIATGAALQSLLSLNNLVGGSVADQALAATSYSARTHPDASRVEAERSKAWIDARLGRVSVSAPSAVTLSSSSGRFAATVTNGLPQPVTVSLDARSDGRLRVDGPRTVDIPANSQQTVLLTARTGENGVHQVTLRVTDKRGVTLGGSTRLSIRSAQVSGVIWLFIGVGALLLFGAIAVRLFRRVQAARHSRAHGGAAGR